MVAAPDGRPRSDRRGPMDQAPGASQPHEHTVTRLLGDLRAGDPRALDDLLPLVYRELHALARRQRRRWKGDETLNTTALVHEAYLRLADQSAPQWSNHAHFLAVASTAMRQILVDYAKRKRAGKREGGRRRVDLREVEAVLAGGGASEVQSDALLALDESLHRLERHDPRQCQVVECRFFGRMTIEDTAEALGISSATVKRGWAMAQAWLYRDLTRTLERDR
jgi:RNA polymerase sigma factor (TIGR02999 family)